MIDRTAEELISTLDSRRNDLLVAIHLVNELTKILYSNEAISLAIRCAKMELEETSTLYTEAFLAFEKYKKEKV